MYHEFSDTDRLLARNAADLALERINAGQLHDTLAYQRPERLDNHTGHYLGALAEIAVSHCLELPWGCYTLGNVDVGDDIEVRRVSHPAGRLLIRPKDLEDDRIEKHVQVYLFEDYAADVLGWVYTVTAWHRGRLCACNTRGSCCLIYHDSDTVAIHPRHMRPISTINGGNQ